MRLSVVTFSLFLGGVALFDCNAENTTYSTVNNKTSQLSTVSAVESSAQDLKRNNEQKIAKLLKQLTLDEKISLVHASGKFHVNAIERLGIPEMWLSDGPHGVRHQIQRHSWDSAGWNDDHATYLPHLTSVAASWNIEMAALHGTVLGSEARHRQKDFILGPGVNLARLPLYGRNFEYMGEDPMLAAKLAVPEIKAIQAQDVAATIKHYALNTQELNRIGVNAKPDERTLREVYLPAFEYAVKEANVWGIMGAYNQYFGTNANQSKHLVMDILKGEWGFNGVLLTDWNVDINTFDAAMNGLDLEMGTNVENYDDYFLAEPLKKLITQGKVPLAVLDEKVTRILRVQHAIGMYDSSRKKGQRNTIKHQQAARKIASEGIVLLKNNAIDGEKVLPLQQDELKNILVLGPNADKKHGQGGGSSEVKSLYEITPLAGLKAQLGDKVKITYMRARRSGLSPIAADYVNSRHWTGTPAWNISYFADQKRTNKETESWIVNAEFNNPDDQIKHITMSAAIKPLASGDHMLKVQAQGSFKLTIDGQIVMAFNALASEQKDHKLTLAADKEYQFEIQYDGRDDFILGWDAPGELFTPEEEYLAAAKHADAVIYFGGLSHGDDREAIDRSDMKLPNGQDEIITKLLAVNANTVVFLIAGSAVEMPWAEQANAIVWGWYGGMEAGHAFADVLFGEVNPSGKMPITLPAKLADTAPIALDDYNAKESLYKEGVFIGYRWFEQQNIKPLFAFGHGLSYSQFSYQNMQLSTEFVKGTQTLLVTADITNTSKRDGSEIVQLYLHDKKASVPRPYKELKGFTKVHLQAGETKRVTLALQQRDLSFWDVKTNNWLAESGEFTVMLAAAADDIRLTADFFYQGDVN